MQDGNLVAFRLQARSLSGNVSEGLSAEGASKVPKGNKEHWLTLAEGCKRHSVLVAGNKERHAEVWR
jgi:hypothetical protein